MHCRADIANASFNALSRSTRVRSLIQPASMTWVIMSFAPLSLSRTSPRAIRSQASGRLRWSARWSSSREIARNALPFECASIIHRDDLPICAISRYRDIGALRRSEGTKPRQARSRGQSRSEPRKENLAILSICGAYGVPRERVAARDTWVPRVNGENFGKLRAGCANNRDAQYPPWRIHGGREGDSLKRAPNGDEWEEFIGEIFPLTSDPPWTTPRANGRKILDTSKSITRRCNSNYRVSHGAFLDSCIKANVTCKYASTWLGIAAWQLRFQTSSSWFSPKLSCPLRDAQLATFLPFAASSLRFCNNASVTSRVRGCSRVGECASARRRDRNSRFREDSRIEAGEIPAW